MGYDSSISSASCVATNGEEDEQKNPHETQHPGQHLAHHADRCWLCSWLGSDGMGVIQERQDRVAEESEATWYEALCLARWFAWNEYQEQFGPEAQMAFSLTNLRFDPNSHEIFCEADRLLHG